MKISIITVTYNSFDVIKDCINSIKLQKHDNIEHIIIDGASTDGTVSFLESKLKQFSTLVSEPDEGVYDAMNKGLKIAQGDIIGFLNSDDFYANNQVLSKVVNIFKKNSSLEACYSDLIYTDQNNISKNVRYWKSSKFVPGSFSKGWCPPHPTFFARRDVFKRFGLFNLDYLIAADNEIMMRFMEVYKIKVQYIPEVWIKMRLGGISNKNLKNIILQNLEVLRALRNNGLSSNLISFCFHKIISRLSQRLNVNKKSLVV